MRSDVDPAGDPHLVVCEDVVQEAGKRCRPPRPAAMRQWSPIESIFGAAAPSA